MDDLLLFSLLRELTEWEVDLEVWKALNGPTVLRQRRYLSRPPFLITNCDLANQHFYGNMHA